MALLDLGPPLRPVDIVFLHATGFNALTYRRVLAPLATTLRILAIDQRGHGASTLATAMPGRHDWLGFRDDLLAALEALGLADVILSGHSMGGTVALLAAAEAPAVARRLVLFDPVLMPEHPGAGASESPMVVAAARRRTVFDSRDAALASYRGRGAFATWPESILRDYVDGGFKTLANGQVALACDPAWEASIYGAQDNDPGAAFAATRCPVDILKAERNSTCRFDVPVVPLRVSVRTVAGTSHFLPMERPDIARSALRSAVNGDLLDTSTSPVPA